MNGHTQGAWRFIDNLDGTFSVFSIGDGLLDDAHGFATNPIAQTCSEGIFNPEANARLIAGAPEMYTALVAAVQTIKATEDFMQSSGLDESYLREIVSTIDGLLDRIDNTALDE